MTNTDTHAVKFFVVEFGEHRALDLIGLHRDPV